MNKWIKQEGVYYPVGDFSTYVSPGPGIFTIYFDDRFKRFGLKKYADKFEFNYKIYDLGLNDFNNMVSSVWNNEYFVKKNQNLGIIFNGVKGSGKTIASKLLCNSIDLPVIILNVCSELLIDFIGMIEFECIILIDEAEKTFNEEDYKSSHTLLKLIDGVMNKSRKLYILTTNRLDINDNLIGRPGRIRYIKQVDGISDSSVVEYLEDNLIHEDMLLDVVNLVKELKVSTIDTLKCIVDEVNMTHSLGTLDCLNLNFKRNRYRIICTENEDVYKKLRKEFGKHKNLDRWFDEVNKDGYYSNYNLISRNYENDVITLTDSIPINYFRIGNKGNLGIFTENLGDNWYKLVSENKKHTRYVKYCLIEDNENIFGEVSLEKVALACESFDVKSKLKKKR